MLLRKNDIAYVWMCVFEDQNTEDSNKHIHIFGDESIPKEHKSRLFAKWNRLNEELLFVDEDGDFVVQYCIFVVPEITKAGSVIQDWDDATPIAYTKAPTDFTTDVYFANPEYSDWIDCSSEEDRLYFSSLLQCCGESSSSGREFVFKQFQDYWNSIVKEIPYISKRGYISDMLVCSKASNYPNVCIELQIDGIWTRYMMPYTQSMLETIIMEKLETQKVREIKRMVLEDE